jgi:hypothetical protein
LRGLRADHAATIRRLAGLVSKDQLTFEAPTTLEDTITTQVFWVLATLLSSTDLCLGQAGKSELFGTVQDPSGLPVLGAKVSADELATGARFSATSADRGEYHLLGLPAGQYSLTIEQRGFRLYKQTGITLRLADQTRPANVNQALAFA